MSIRRQIGDSRARRRVERFSNRVGTATPFVGRKRELECLRAALASAGRESGRLLFVSGEPGIGKTRLVEQFALAAERKGTRVYRGSAWQRSGTPPYWPWTQLFLAYLADPDGARMQPSGSSAALLGTKKSTQGVANRARYRRRPRRSLRCRLPILEARCAPLAALCGSDGVRVRAALDEAISARLIVPAGGGGHFAFRHDLVREAGRPKPGWMELEYVD